MSDRNGDAIRLSVVMAGLNEAANVEKALSRMVEALAREPGGFEILVVDDGSTDGTGDIAERFAAREPRVRVLRNERNLNYGISLLRGMEAARGEWVTHQPMDLPLAPEEFALFTPHFAGTDVLVLTRIDREAHTPWRRLMSWSNNLLLRALFAPPCADMNFIQFYRREVLRSIRVRSTGPASVTPELILRAARRGFRVREVPAHFRRRQAGKAHFGHWRYAAWTLGDLARLRVSTWRHGWDA
jgi:glycosyltransferase involved in cell wall biosynthesis